MNFENDVIYIGAWDEFVHFGLGKAFRLFLDYGESSMIQKLALGLDVFDELPIDIGPEATLIDTQKELARYLKHLKQMMIILNCQELWSGVQHDTPLAFREYSVREKRRNPRTEYARPLAKVHGEVMQRLGRTVEYRIGTMEVKDMYGDPNFV